MPSESSQAPTLTSPAAITPSTSKPYSEYALKADLISFKHACDAAIATVRGDLESKMLELIHRIEMLEHRPLLAVNITELRSRVERLELDPISGSVVRTTTHTTKQSEPPSDRAVCQAGCDPEIVARNNGLELVACCGDVVLHSQACSADPCAIQADLAAVKSKLGL